MVFHHQGGAPDRRSGASYIDLGTSTQGGQGVVGKLSCSSSHQVAKDIYLLFRASDTAERGHRYGGLVSRSHCSGPGERHMSRAVAGAAQEPGGYTPTAGVATGLAQRRQPHLLEFD